LRWRGPAWLSQLSKSRLGHDWATRLCLGRQRSAMNHARLSRPQAGILCSPAIRSAVCSQASALWSSRLQV
jgi:hypothetical protein